MNVYTFTINLEDKLNFVNDHKTQLIANNNPYVDYCFSILDTKIIFYKSQKVVVQGKNAEIVASKYFEKYVLDKNPKNDSDNSRIDTNKSIIIGSDEVGVGDYFGGLVVCATAVKKDYHKELIALGVNDSKKITDEKIKVLAPKIMELVDYQVEMMYPEQYNNFITRFNNSHMLKTFLHNKAFNSLIKKFNRSDVLVVLDEYASAKNYYNYLKTMNINEVVNVDIFETKAESKYLSVACGSIIARYFFLKQIEELSLKAKISLPLGAWNKTIEYKAKQVKLEFGFENLKYFVKLHFKNTEKI